MANLGEQMELQWVDQDAGWPPKEQAPSHRSAEEAQAEQALALEWYIRNYSGQDVSVHLSRTRRTMVSMRPNRKGCGYNLRINPMFLTAPKRIHEVLAKWVKHPNTSTHHKALEKYLRENPDKIVVRRRGVGNVSTLGFVYDLKMLRDDVNVTHFDKQLEVPITWGRMPGRTNRRSIRFGSYAPQDHLIRIHPLLDQEFVPAYFIRYIVFHEMLHAQVGIQHKNGRRLIHSPEFNRREREYPDYERAIAWMNDRKNLKRLLDS